MRHAMGHAMRLLALAPSLLVLAVVAAPPAGAARRKAGFLTGGIVSAYECPGATNVIFARNYSQLLSPDGQFTFSSSYDVMRGTKFLSKAHIAFDSCTPGIASSCENISNWRVGREACSLWVNKMSVWSKFAESIHPHFICPFQPGHYEIVNMSLNVQRMEIFPVENREWTSTMTTWGDDGKLWSCASVRIKVYRAGRRKGQDHKDK